MNINISINNLIYNDIEVAKGFYSRLIGLIDRKYLNNNQGLLLKKCKSVHTFFMKIPIDIVYLDKNYKILFFETLNPWRVGRFIKGTKHILELKKGESLNMRYGDYIKFIDEC